MKNEIKKYKYLLSQKQESEDKKEKFMESKIKLSGKINKKKTKQTSMKNERKFVTKKIHKKRKANYNVRRQD